MTSTRRPFRNTEFKLKLLEERLKVGTWAYEHETSEVTWSDGLFRMIGIDPTSVVPTLELLMSLMHPEDRLGHSSTAELVADPRIRSRRFRIIRPDGRLLHVHNHAEPHFDRGGKLIMMVGVTADVTAQEELRLQMREQQQVVNILDELGAGYIWRADQQGKLKDATHWRELTGQSQEEARDWDRLAAIHPDDRATFRAAWGHAITTRSEYSATIRVRSEAGHYLTVMGRGMPARIVDDEVVEWLGFSRVVSAPICEHDELQPSQIRAARALLDWSARELAEKAGVSFSTLRRMEKSTENIQAAMISKVRSVLLSSGILLHNDGRGRVGASLA